MECDVAIIGGLPIYMAYGLVYKALQREREIQCLVERFMYQAQLANMAPSPDLGQFCTEALEGLVTEGWVKASRDPSVPGLNDYPGQG